MTAKTTILNLPEEEFIYPGNRACAGCGLGIIYRIATKALGKNTMLLVPPSCLTVVQGLYPIAATKLPCINVTFASTAAAASGVRAALLSRKKEGITVAAWAGDGGTADIGIQALSGACERGDDFIFFCYDNEAYMNTGVQRSGTTPKGVITTNTPFKGKRQHQKDMATIMAAHGINYVASCSPAYPTDLYDKVMKAKSIPGTKYLHIHTPCPTGWGFEPRYTVKVGRLAVECGLYDLYEIEYGKFRLTGPSKKLSGETLKPVKEYFQAQGRFKGFTDDQITEEETRRNAKWEAYDKKESA